MKIAALDLALGATGYAVATDRAWPHSGVHSPSGARGMPRLAKIRSAVIELVDGCDLVVIEGYAYSTQGMSHVRSIAELGGVIRMTLHDLGYTWVDVPPASLKKYATGAGNARKDKVLVEAVRRMGYTGSSHDEADALWLLQMARDWYGHTEVTVPKAHREALRKIDWPEIQGGS